jgi:hypothetical protein
VPVTGISGSVPISATGGEIYVALSGDAGCTTGPGWLNGSQPSGTITNGQYIKLNLPSGNSYGVTATRTITVGTYSTTWSVTTITDACTGSPAPGTTCSDGSKFAGWHPIWGTRMFIVPANMGYQPFGWPEVTYGQADWWDGRANTNVLAQTGTNHAINACYNLTAYGKDDWYLPAPGEWDVIDPYRNAIGGFEPDGYPIWSSLEQPESGWEAAWYHFMGGGNDYNVQGLWYPVRCIRRE